MRFLFSLFGYCKIPKEVVYLSVMVESFVESMVDFINETSPAEKQIMFNRYKDAAKCITKFLRSGRLLNKGEK